jgi:hypothetical protein
MQMPDMPMEVPVDDPNADTEWSVVTHCAVAYVHTDIRLKERHPPQTRRYPRKAALPHAHDPRSPRTGARPRPREQT